MAQVPIALFAFGSQFVVFVALACVLREYADLVAMLIAFDIHHHIDVDVESLVVP